ncbi:rhodanese-like domain-containing protein [Aquirufa antheringensis]|jgi:rhodanese-related sulfurtransferase|uniref:rhodanese-like domain-containing protein n=1 Tax=Aquirufa antheringensis TaxID=2516559 RepID=UPI0022A9EE4D|nr:rhodanese-like domain-containing protein [Aquirufa antheringensis]MCZ2484067.1 rhodanese-like domain-containing protein [Aquirufa antheringensis]
MLELLKNLFGFGPKVDFKALLADGATLVDVRTPAEFKDGHIKGAINLPLQTLGSNLNKLKKDQVIITCCRSGSRSRMARRQLQAAGYTQVYNGGPWTSLKA